MYHNQEIDWVVNSLGSLIFRGLSPEESDLQYLKIAASKLVMFGVDAHPARVWDSFICCFMIDEPNWSTGTCNTLHVMNLGQDVDRLYLLHTHYY